MIYKTLKKVSDVCQLLDKSKYFATQTINGVKFTKNDDGTFTANGTATANIDYRGVSYNAKENIVAGRKYLMRGCPAGGSEDTYYMRLIYLGYDYGNGLIAEVTDSGAAYYDIQIIVKAGTVCDNLIFKPQLFDLTEMYGAGNEPTTVEEFRQDFPEELYDYKPYCFVKSYKTLLKATDDKIITSYKKSLICTTKNLLDINQSINSSAENAFDTFSINDNVITATSDNSTTKIVIMRLFYGELSAGDYILSLNAVIENTPKHNRPNEIFIFKNGSVLTLNNSMPTDGSYSPKIKFTLSEKATIEISFYKNVGSSQETVSDTVYKVTLSNIQLELGDTATEYHPYGYL